MQAGQWPITCFGSKPTKAMSGREQVIATNWGPDPKKQLTPEQVERISRFGKWEGTESRPFQIVFAYKKKKEEKRVKEKQKSTCLPFTDDVVPDSMVGRLTISNLREAGYHEFWLDSKRIDDLVNIIQDGGSTVEPIGDFCRKYVEGIVLSHHVDWRIPKEAAVMGMMPAPFLNSAMWDLKQEPIDTWRSINGKSDPINKTEKRRAGFYHVFKMSGNTAERTYLSKWLEQSVRNFKEDFLASAVNITDAAERAKWKIYAEGVRTEFASLQKAHLDMPEELREQSYMIHIPLQREGSMLSVFDNEAMTHRYVYIPFGTYLALRGDVWHSGIFGKPGNLRFHLVIVRGDLPEPAILHGTDTTSAEVMEALRGEAEREFGEKNGGKAMHEAFLDWHERQTLYFVEAWERVLANYNGGRRVSGLLSNLDLAAIRKKREAPAGISEDTTGQQKRERR